MSNCTEVTPPMSCPLATLKKRRTRKVPHAVSGALVTIVAVIFLLGSVLVVRASDVPSSKQQLDSKRQHRWPDDAETAYMEEAGVEQQGEENVRLRRRAEEGPDAVYLRTTPDGGDGVDDRTKPTVGANPGSFLELAQQRFFERQGRSATSAENQWTFQHLQLLRVPKAASSEASLVARRLAGCTPNGPCCKFPGDPPGSCPAHGLMCSRVTGCTSHNMDDEKKRELLSPSVFSMSNIRDSVDRIVSGFFYTPPHSPRCARGKDVDYESCFQEMITSLRFQNVASKMLIGYNAYDDSTKVCSTRDAFSSSSSHPSASLTANVCGENMAAIIEGACHLNYITICEAWGSSLLLLFETLPWLGPTDEFFPIAASHAKSSENVEATDEERQEPQHSRQNPKKEEGMKHITAHMMELARRTNGADVELYEFVTAKFCNRLRDTGLLENPIVQDELSHRDQLEERCYNASWVADTLETFEPLTPEHCRLFEPLDRPQDL